MRDFFKYVVIPIVVSLVILVCFILSIIFVNVYFFDNVPVKCYVDNILVYSGTSAGIKVLSTGRTTRVDINGGFLYMFPKEYYVSDNVKLEGKK